MQLPDPNRIAHDLAAAVANYNALTERGIQKTEGRLGISDIGYCREYARFITVEQEPTDEPEKWRAAIGSALDDYIKRAVAAVYPDVRTDVECVLTLPSGSSYPGHPDLVLANGVIDCKSKFGLTQQRRQGPTDGEQFQRHGYAGALIQAGQLPEDCWVGNAWWDRTGREFVPHVQIEPYDPLWLHKADDWMTDVTYAVLNRERASQDRPLNWCQAVCEFYTVCREDDLLQTTGLIDRVEDLDMIDAYYEAKQTIKMQEGVLEDVKAYFAGVEGTTGEHIVRWTHVNETEVPGFTKAPHDRFTIRPVPKARSKR